VGTQAHGARHILRAPNVDQVPGPSGFCGRMDRDSAAPLVTQEHWSMYFDGSLTFNSARGGVVLISPKGDRFLYVIRLHIRATNNVADYEALLNGLCIIAELGVQRFYICGDSKLVINQVMGESNYCNSLKTAHQQEVRRLEEKFDSFELPHSLRQDNEAVDALTRLRSSREPPPLGLFSQNLFKPSILLKEDILVCSLGASLDEGISISVPGTPSGESDPALISEAKPGARLGGGSYCQAT
jgi:ribonuclease HI